MSRHMVTICIASMVAFFAMMSHETLLTVDELRKANFEQCLDLSSVAIYTDMDAVEAVRECSNVTGFYTIEEYLP